MTAQAYFQNIEQEIIKQLEAAHQSILVAVYCPSNDAIFNKLYEKASDNVKVEMMVDTKQNKPHHNCRRLEDSNGIVYYINEAHKKGFDQSGFLHHKFCIIDNRILITGSYNWSYRGQQNYENIVVITDDIELCKQFKLEFEEIRDKYQKDIEWQASGKKNDIALAIENDAIKANQKLFLETRSAAKKAQKEKDKLIK